MSPTTIADPALIPDIDAFEERVAIHIRTIKFHKYMIFIDLLDHILFYPPF